VTEQNQAGTAKVNNPVGRQPVPTKQTPKATVDLEQEIAIQSLYSTVVFKPNQVIKDPRLLQLARDNGIPIRYK
jgi:hypothetical protein